MSSTEPSLKFQTGHVGLNVTNVALSKRFYQEVFNLKVVAESDEKGREYVFLGDGQRLVLTLWQQGRERFDKGRAGLHHLSFQVDDIEQVHAVEHRLKRFNVAFAHEGVVPHGEGTHSAALYFEDPDGTRLEVFSPTGGAGLKAPTPGAPSCGFF